MLPASSYLLHHIAVACDPVCIFWEHICSSSNVFFFSFCLSVWGILGVALTMAELTIAIVVNLQRKVQQKICLYDCLVFFSVRICLQLLRMSSCEARGCNVPAASCGFVNRTISDLLWRSTTPCMIVRPSVSQEAVLLRTPSSTLLQNTFEK